jgi:hypothetical protein
MSRSASPQCTHGRGLNCRVCWPTGSALQRVIDAANRSAAVPPVWLICGPAFLLGYARRIGIEGDDAYILSRFKDSLRADGLYYLGEGAPSI